MGRRAIPHGRQWVLQIFQAQAARNGGIVRRSIQSVLTHASHAILEAEVRRRGFHLVESGGQYVIFCHQGHFQMIC